MNPDLIKKLDKRRKYSWHEVMEISTSIATWVVVELIHNKEARDKIIMDLFVPKPNINIEPNSRRRKKQSKST